MKIILASNSKTRKKILDSLNIKYDVIVSDKEEVANDSDPRKYVEELSKILDDLASWSVIILKKHLNSYSIYEGSDFDIEHALDEAYSAIPTLEIQKLADIANFKPIIAKRHYHKYGCMRWLDVILTPVNKYKDFLETEYAHAKSIGFFSIFFSLLCLFFSFNSFFIFFVTKTAC